MQSKEQNLILEFRFSVWLLYAAGHLTSFNVFIYKNMGVTYLTDM